MGIHCTTCTCSIGPLNADQLLAILTFGTPHREVYRAAKGGWFVTHGGGEADAHAVLILVENGAIHSVYDTTPDSGYHVGKTLDMKATQEARRGKRKTDGKICVYTDGTRKIKEWK